MSLKDLFKEQNYKYLGNSSVNSLTGSGVESAQFVEKFIEEKDKFVPLVDYSNPENFARFGSAEKYYYDSIKRTYETYPYDGSKKEKILWELSSSNLDLYLFENGYPRTTGYANFLVAASTSGNQGFFYPPVSNEYILVKGGPHPGSGKSIYVDPDTGEAHFRKNANLYDISNNRENNLLIDGTKGNTVEFWLKKDAYVANQEYFEFIVDAQVTGTTRTSTDYGRLSIALATTGTANNTSNQAFFVSYASGSTNNIRLYMGAPTLTTASIADGNWHHYAVRMRTQGNETLFDLFVDGKHNDSATGLFPVGYVSGTIVASVGAQVEAFYDGTSDRGGRGWSPFSGSIDEFRYWKRWRTSKQIQTRWFDQVGGGTNTDLSNTDLGVYFKFNEGILGKSATDSKVLDYSGRVSNGTWIGYSSAGSRETGSAINESGLTTYTATEFKDPILYSSHPEVFSFMQEKRKEGKEYDYRNSSTIYYSLPSWILEEHEPSSTEGDGLIANSLWNLTQIISSYFDNVANMMSSMPALSQTNYFSASFKPIPFMSRILESKGFVAPEIFNAIEALEYFENRDDDTVYAEKISNIKNLIYKNIYNNLTYINKTKGTEKSFRNLIRCFGIDDQIYKLNYYSNNVDFVLEDNYRLVSDKFKLANFNTIENSDASVYQFSSSLNTNTKTFISASKNFSVSDSRENSLPFSVESNVVFPLRVDESKYNTLATKANSYRNNYPLLLTASLFGMHTARDFEPEDTTWDSNDYANFVVEAIKPKLFSNKAKFMLTGTAGGFIPKLTSSYYDDVYNDTPWHFLVCLYPEKYPNANQVPGTTNSDYVVEFSGIQKTFDVTLNQFTVTGSITAAEAVKFLASPKRTFVGAHRTNFTGSLLRQSDVEVNSFRVWQNKLTLEDLSVHASDPSNYSIKNPEQNAYLFNEKTNNVFVPNKETLLLHWDFDTVTGSNASGQFIVEDLTSGSINQKPRYGYLQNIVNKQYTGLGFDFSANSTTVVSSRQYAISKPNMPETITNENTVKVLTNDDKFYNRDKRPVFFDLYVEKSPYQIISEEMLKFMSTTVSYNNLIGHTVDRYRGEYKSLNVLKQLFFERMDTPNVDKYIEYFKWFDLAVSAMIQKLAPMSSGLDERPLRNIIESHILERNKYESKFPTYEFKQSDPEGSLFGINELLYPWKEGHAQLPFGPANNHAVDFDGTNDFVNLQHPSNLTFTNTSEEYTLSAWIKTTDNNAAIISHARATAGHYGYLLQVFSGDLYAVQGGSSNNIRGDAVNDGQWHHVALVNYDDGGTKKFKLYLDGAQNGPIGTSQNPAIDLSTNTDILIGASRALNNGDTTLHMDGQISEVSIWGTGLSAGQIAEIYNSGQPCNLSNHSAYSNLITWIRMGANVSGVTLPDIKGSNNGTMTNFTAPFGVVLTDDLKFCASGKGDEANNCLWWRERVERSNVTITSGDTDVDSDRQEIINVINNQTNVTPPNLSSSAGTYQGSTYALRRFPRPYKINAVKQPQIHGGGNAHENKKVGFWDSIRKRPTLSTPGEGGLISIEPPDSKLESFKSCDDNLALNKGKRKFKFSAGVAIDGQESFSNVFKGDLVFPFSLYSSSVTNNPAMADLADFQANLAITNLHHDNYGPFNDVPMQGPFTEKYVGGRAYRHVMTNFTVDNEQPEGEGERLEGWRLTASLGALDLVNVSPHNPKSVYFREEYAKRPVNIKNIQQTTGAAEIDSETSFAQGTDAAAVTKIGNYTNTYEIVLTNGRSINNRYLVESEGDLASITAESMTVSGVIDFELPRRDLTGSNKAIIVNRFSAPGDPATMAEGILDVAAGEFSVYNALPFRNLSVHGALNELHSDHTNQFGLFSDARTVADFEIAGKAYPGGSSSINDPGADLSYIGTGSFHKVNRNTRLQPEFSSELSSYENSGAVTIDTSFDNFFVQHQIPQTDVQYAWITASLVNNYTGTALYGFEQPDFSNASLASTDLVFVSASDSGSTNIKVDFVGLNTLVIDGVFSNLNLLSSSDYYNDSIESLDDILTVNAINSHRGGPYGGSSWKLHRKNSHPVARAHREENRLSFLEISQVTDVDANTNTIESINSVIEPPITSKYKQLSHIVTYSVGPLSDDSPGELVQIDHSYMNNIRFFADHEADNIDLDDKLLSKRNIKEERQTLDAINHYIFQTNDFAGTNLNPIKGLESYITRETIFPREQYTYLSFMRQRENYENGFWRDDPTVRRDRATDRPFTGTGFVKPYNYITNSPNESSTILLYYQRPVTFSGSIWPLDARENYTTRSPGRIRKDLDEGLISVLALRLRPAISSSDGAGILQNGAYPFSNYAFVSSTGGGFTEPNRLRGHTAYASLYPQYNRRVAGVIPTDSDYEYKFGDNKWDAGAQSGLAPFYDTYSEYAEDIKRIGKDYGLLPEFRISEHMEFYINESANGFFANPVAGKLGSKGVLEITGTALQDSSDADFASTYSHSDFLKTFSIVSDFYGNKSKPSRITLSANALIKLLPYDGFYPADRSVQITKLFYESYSASFDVKGAIIGDGGLEDIDIDIGQPLAPSRAGYMNPVWKSLFAPGILYNSIKSGIAVDYPVHTLQSEPVTFTGSPNQRISASYLIDIPRITKDFDFRVPFEALLDPETAFGNKFILDNEPHPSASVNLTASISNAAKPNYKLAMNNFLASTVDFFLPNGQMSSITSQFSDVDGLFNSFEDPDTGDVGFQVGKEYRMRLACFNGKIQTKNAYLNVFDDMIKNNADEGQYYYSASYDVNPPSCVMYAQTGAIAGDLNKVADYYGSSFGPPVRSFSLCRNTATTRQAAFPQARRSYSSASFEPFTPPYHNGYAHIEYTFKPLIEDDFADLTTIFEKLTASYERSMLGEAGIPCAPGSVAVAGRQITSTATKNAMVMSASFTRSVREQFKVTFDQFGNPTGGDTDSAAVGFLATFQPKWETPILNFRDADVTLATIGSASAARGMWHQYGVKPAEDEGIYFQIQELERSEKTDFAQTGSLALQLGLPTNKVKLGRVAPTKKISEAIVAIPFIASGGADGEGVNNIKRFTIESSFIDTAKEIVKKRNKGIDTTVESNSIPDESIIDMVDKMQRFVIPPHLDFLTNITVTPFAMFIIEFSVDLTQADLSNIWQNLNPNISRGAKQKTASLPANIFSKKIVASTGLGELQQTSVAGLLEDFPENTRWMVFKVKQRSASNYFAKTASQKDDENFDFNFGSAGEGEGIDFLQSHNYNWPYDFFSLIELAKVDANIENKLVDKTIGNSSKQVDPGTGMVEEGPPINAPGSGEQFNFVIGDPAQQAAENEAAILGQTVESAAQAGNGGGTTSIAPAPPAADIQLDNEAPVIPGGGGPGSIGGGGFGGGSNY